MDRDDHTLEHRELADGELDLRGRVGTFALSDVLQLVGFSGRTGTPSLIQEGNTRTIS